MVYPKTKYMEFPNRRIIELIVKDVDGTASADEAAELSRWVAEDPEHALTLERLREPRVLGEGLDVYRKAMGRSEEAEKLVFSKVEEALQVTPVQSIWGWRMVAAASLLIGLVGGAIWLYRDRNAPAPAVALAREPLAPGRNKATLILADRKEVVLDDVNKGAIARQGEARVTKTDSGEIAYNIEPQSQPTAGKPGLDDNTILTPRGGQYRLRLADGTMVFLNAQSSLRFPVSFGEKERRVFLQGEAYFDVAPDAHRPFKVNVGSGQEVTVLGTRFNVQDYQDDGQTEATLLEGKIRVENGSRQAMMAPGEMAKWRRDGSLMVEKEDMAEASIAWTRGLFRFRNASLADVMRQLSRWYDVDVVFEGTPPAIPITASISRNTSAWEVLDALKEIAGLKYKVEGRKVIVLR